MLLEGTEEIVSVLDRNQLGPTVLDLRRTLLDLRLYRLPHALEPHGRQFFQTLTLGIDCDAYGF